MLYGRTIPKGVGWKEGQRSGGGWRRWRKGGTSIKIKDESIGPWNYSHKKCIPELSPLKWAVESTKGEISSVLTIKDRAHLAA